MAKSTPGIMNVAEVNNADVSVANGLNQHEKDAEPRGGQHKKRAAVGKIVDELGNGVVGHGVAHEHFFADPALRKLVTCNLDPNRIAVLLAVVKHHLSDHHFLTGFQDDGVGREHHIDFPPLLRRKE